MPRKHKASPATKSYGKKVRREKKIKHNPSDLTWLIRSTLEMTASKILNARTPRPYWLSVEIDEDKTELIASFYPCEHFRKEGRIYYGFSFLEHREAQMDIWSTIARRELTSRIIQIAPANCSVRRSY